MRKKTERGLAMKLPIVLVVFSSSIALLRLDIADDEHEDEPVHGPNSRQQ